MQTNNKKHTKILVLSNKQMKNKKAFTLLELIFSIAILGIIIASAGAMIGMLFKENRKTFDISMAKINFETTRLFLESKIQNDPNLALLSYANNKLYYDNDLLNENISSFSKQSQSDNIALKICIQETDNFCTDIHIKR